MTEGSPIFLVRTEQPILDPAWTVTQLTLEDLVLAYMGRSAQPEQPARPVLEVQR